MEEKIVIILNEMSEYLSIAQMKKLQEVVLKTFSENEVNRQEISNKEFLQMFLDAKRIEGCSERTIQYYSATVEHLLSKMTESVRKITTEEIRTYLSDYQKLNNCSNVTIDNIRRNISSFFSWLEEEDYILKSPMKRIHKIKTKTVVKNVISDDSGNIRKGCKIVKKGEAYERTLFTAKNKLIKQENFLDEAKLFYTDLINLLIEDDKEKLHVFNKNGLYLATKKIGKNNPKAEQIREDNEVRMRWNYEVDRAIVSEVPEEKIRQIKQEWITDRVRESVEIFGSRPERLAGIITTAIMKLALLISKVLETARKLKARLILENLIDTQERRVAETTATDVYAEEVVSTPGIAIVPTVENKEVTEPHKPQIPPKPAMPPDAAVYPKLQRIKNELDKQNEIIFKAEHERNLLEIERDDLHGISRLTKKRELDSKIERKNEEIDILKSGLSGIVKRYEFDTVQQFYNAIKIAQDATYKYQMDVATWEENYGEKTPPKATFEERLRIYQREADQQHTQRNYHSRDKGAR